MNKINDAVRELVISEKVETYLSYFVTKNGTEQVKPISALSKYKDNFKNLVTPMVLDIFSDITIIFATGNKVTKPIPFGITPDTEFQNLMHMCEKFQTSTFIGIVIKAYDDLKQELQDAQSLEFLSVEQFQKHKALNTELNIVNSKINNTVIPKFDQTVENHIHLLKSDKFVEYCELKSFVAHFQEALKLLNSKIASAKDTKQTDSLMNYKEFNETYGWNVDSVKELHTKITESLAEYEKVLGGIYSTLTGIAREKYDKQVSEVKTQIDTLVKRRNAIQNEIQELEIIGKQKQQEITNMLGDIGVYIPESIKLI
jgi:hypothetical protein